MRYVLSVLVIALSMAAPAARALANEASRTVKDRAEVADAVAKVFSNAHCTLINENLLEEYGSGFLATQFRMRCEVAETSARAMLKELEIAEGIAVARVALHPAVQIDGSQTSLDLKFVAVARIEE